MARRRRREAGLIALALNSDWPVGAALAVGTWVGSRILARMLAQDRFLAGLAGAVGSLGWLLALIFAGIAAFRWLQSHQQAHPREPVPRSDWSAPVASARPRETVEHRAPPLPDEPFVAVAHTDVGETVASRPEVWSEDVLQRMEWKRLEDICCAYYRAKGIRAETTPLGADGGIDIRLYQDAGAPERMTAVVQCKAHARAVGVKDVRELRGVMAHEQVEKGFFFAPGGFTDEAIAFAGHNRIVALDARLFLAMLVRLPAAERDALLEQATAGAWTTPTCPRCGMTMVVRHGRRGEFWGCPGYPRCHGMLPMRRAPA